MLCSRLSLAASALEMALLLGLVVLVAAERSGVAQRLSAPLPAGVDAGPSLSLLSVAAVEGRREQAGVTTAGSGSLIG